jgi:site-specific DNA-cytosine methylase
MRGNPERRKNMYPVDSKALTGITVADCFAGIGAFHLAFKSFGAEVEWACEWDQDAADVYEANYGMRPAGDITKIDEALGKFESVVSEIIK